MSEDDPTSDFHYAQLISDITSEIANATYLGPAAFTPSGLACPTSASQLKSETVT